MEKYAGLMACLLNYFEDMRWLTWMKIGQLGLYSPVLLLPIENDPVS